MSTSRTHVEITRRNLNLALSNYAFTEDWSLADDISHYLEQDVQNCIGEHIQAIRTVTHPDNWIPALDCECPVDYENEEDANLPF